MNDGMECLRCGNHYYSQAHTDACGTKTGVIYKSPHGNSVVVGFKGQQAGKTDKAICDLQAQLKAAQEERDALRGRVTELEEVIDRDMEIPYCESCKR